MPMGVNEGHNRRHRDIRHLVAIQNLPANPHDILELCNTVLIVVVPDPDMPAQHLPHCRIGGVDVSVTLEQIVPRYVLFCISIGIVRDVIVNLVPFLADIRDRNVLPELEVVRRLQGKVAGVLSNLATLRGQDTEPQTLRRCYPLYFQIVPNLRPEYGFAHLVHADRLKVFLVYRLFLADDLNIVLEDHRHLFHCLLLVAFNLGGDLLLHVRHAVSIARNKGVLEPRKAGKEPVVLVQNDVVQDHALLLSSILVLGIRGLEFDH